MIEMIVALCVLVIMMAFLMGLITSVNKLAGVQRGQSELYEQQRLLFDLLDRDIRGMVVSNTPGSEISCRFLGTACALVTTSGVGVQNDDSSVLSEVVYRVDTDSTLVRSYTFCQQNQASWNFLGKTDQSWAPTPADPHAVVVGSVAAFDIRAYVRTDTGAYDPQTDATDTCLPSYVTIEVQLYDPRMRGSSWSADDVNKTKKTFRRLIHLQREF